MSGQQFRCNDYVFEFVGDPELVSELETLLADLSVDSVGCSHVWDVEVFEAHARVIVDGTKTLKWITRDRFPAAVISMLTMSVIETEPSHLHLHAGAVVSDGNTILLVAPSGSGKSTSTCALVAAGARYRTDEVVAVDRDGLGITTYPKPISLKESGIGVVERLTGLSCPSGATTWQIPASSIGALAHDVSGPVATIVFNTYMPSKPVHLEPVDRATAVRLMLSDSQDAVVIGPESVVAAARLAQRAQCLQVSGGDAAEVAAAILDAHRMPSDPGKVFVVPPSVMGGGPCRAPGVCSVVIDGRAVLYAPEPDQLIELDESQTLWWVLLDGTSFDRVVEDVAHETGLPIPEVLAAGQRFVAGFRSLGVLHEV